MASESLSRPPAYLVDCNQEDLLIKAAGILSITQTLLYGTGGTLELSSHDAARLAVLLGVVEDMINQANEMDRLPPEDTDVPSLAVEQLSIK